MKELFLMVEKTIGRKININKSEDRWTIQALTLIFQSMSGDFGYKFLWHWKCPYSCALAKDMNDYYYGN